ncbi:PLP-dependent transferase [Crucibulum laeve]|uniref:PLP-dependent transferase n=1 Tax=Crucibulum laeve TaxID=68775 RepID=A0A5C3MJV2_9AGAR|nr:PLP-dependent transferase [Crucibulum laeve]
MGNSHSIDHSPNKRSLARKRSVLFSRLSLGCISVDPSIHSSEISQAYTLVNEKSRLRDYQEHSSDVSKLAYTPTYDTLPGEALIAYESFLAKYPEYRLTWILDTLRRTDFTRLERMGETYVDYMGGSLYPESLVRVHSDFLSHNILGNTHSVSNSSKLSLQYANEARSAVLSFFRAPPEYTVIFTANASNALKLIGESYPFVEGSTFVLGTDSHNSVHGIREYAVSKGARTIYIPSERQGGLATTAKDILTQNLPCSGDLYPSLFAITGQSNISNSKNSLTMIKYASSMGYHTLLDAAALAPTTTFSLTDSYIDAMAVSFYKMFGFPTGVGALVVKKSFLSQLKRPWFAGGTVDVVQVPGNIVTRSRELHEQFEDGTINYLLLPAVTDGLRFLSAYLPFLPLRLSSLLSYLIDSLSKLCHDVSGTKVVQILSRTPAKRLRSVGEQSDTGSIISLIFIDSTGNMIPNSFIEYSAAKQNISLRTGCLCNPGGAAALLGIESDMCKLFPGVTLKDFEYVVGRELGVVRISLGLASNFYDVWNVVQFASSFGKENLRQSMWEQWMEVRNNVVHPY